jgi:eukaryotic-like serine/threonine-protein kinase
MRLRERWRHAARKAIAAAQTLLVRAERRISADAPEAAPQPAAAPQTQRQLETLIELNRDATRTLDPDQTVRAALDALARMLQAERTLLLWVSEVSGSLSLHAARDAAGNALAEPVAYDAEFVARVRAEHLPLVAQAGAGAPPQALSTLVAPLMLAERLVGVVYVDSRSPRSELAEEDLAFLLAVANHIAVAIETARVSHLEAFVAAERMQRRLAETLASVAAVLTATLDLDEVLGRLLQNLALVVPFDSAAVLLRENAHFRVVAAHGQSEAVAVRRLILPAGDALLGEVLASRRPITIADVRVDARYWGYGGTDYTRAWLGLPLLAGDEVIGLLTIDSRVPAAYGENEAAVAFAFAGQAAIAIRNARLFGQMQRMAATDALTETHNRHRFFELAEAEWEAARLLGRPLAVMMLDIDHFKRVNDTHGHAVGDAVLRAVADRCRAALREADVLGRYGGEEFAVLLPGTELAAATQVAERLRLLIDEVPLQFAGGEIAVTISVGVAAADDATPTLAALLNRADEALYEAKTSGRNRVVAS